MVWMRSTTLSNTSRVVGSSQWASSSVIRTGCWRASLSKWASSSSIERALSTAGSMSSGG